MDARDAGRRSVMGSLGGREPRMISARMAVALVLGAVMLVTQPALARADVRTDRFVAVFCATFPDVPIEQCRCLARSRAGLLHAATLNRLIAASDRGADRRIWSRHLIDALKPRVDTLSARDRRALDTVCP